MTYLVQEDLRNWQLVMYKVNSLEEGKDVMLERVEYFQIEDVVEMIKEMASMTRQEGEEECAPGREEMFPSKTVTEMISSWEELERGGEGGRLSRPIKKHVEIIFAIFF